jgi:hypothetical protein
VLEATSTLSRATTVVMPAPMMRPNTAAAATKNHDRNLGVRRGSSAIVAADGGGSAEGSVVAGAVG